MDEPEIKHKTKPGHMGYRYGCRCDQGCAQAGEIIKARQRKRRVKAVGRDPSTFVHGVNGYRVYGCRCEVCKPAGELFNRENRILQAERRERKRVQKAIEAEAALQQYVAEGQRDNKELAASATTIAMVDWSEVAHLKPGHNVRNRARDSPSPDLITQPTTNTKKEST